MAKPDLPLTVTVESFEGFRATLRFPGDQLVSVSRRFVPRKAKEDDVLTVDLVTSEQQTKRQANLAKAILEELLGGE